MLLRSESSDSAILYPRKGGGGRGIGKIGKIGKSGGGSSSSGSRSSSSSGGGAYVGGATFGATSGSFTGSTSSYGSKKKRIISAGPFAGREVGGGTRADVYGTSVYGSGYPGSRSIGVSGRGFPFYFYPVVWPVMPYYPIYISNSSEYGSIDNATRPGGPLMQFSLQTSESTFRIVTDNITSHYLYVSLQSKCGTTKTSLGLTIGSPVGFNDTAGIVSRPEQAVTYYRGSTVVLTLDGYNNTAIFNVTDQVATPLPLPASTNMTALHCINDTVGSTVLLAGATTAVPQASLCALITLFVMILHYMHML